MSETENETTAEGGFEYRGRFYPLRVSDMGKDLMLIDRLSGVSIFDFHELIDEALERGRGGVLLALIATSMRAEHPEWSVDKLVRTVMELRMSDVEWARREGDDVHPLSETAGPEPPVEPESETPPTNGASSQSPSNGSSGLSTPVETSSLETWSETLP